MEHKLFKPASFEEGRESAVGACNGLSMSERWENETPPFAKAILGQLPAGGKTIVDYGVGVGRLAKEVLAQNQDKDLRLIGVDDSSDQRRYAKLYVADDRFQAMLPEQFEEPADLIYCIYVLHHVAAIEFRDVLARMHYFLKPEGRFVHCSSDDRMAIRFDKPGFFEDRFLGLNIRAEIERFFEPIAPLFTAKDFEAHDAVRKMVTGDDGKGTGRPHSAMVYKKRTLVVPYFLGKSVFVSPMEEKGSEKKGAEKVEKKSSPRGSTAKRPRRSKT